jgi:CHAT domain-containing protein/tetratricopeptide (TPR) repeat protein
LAVFAQSAPRAWAEPAAEQQKAAELADLFQRWRETQDAEEKIALGERALLLEPKLSLWTFNIARDSLKGELWFGLGSAYASRALGVRAENLEKSIAHFESALTVFTREADPQNWASTHNNAGIAYWGRIRGDRADNQERAIAHFEAALTVFTREAFPQPWAQLENNLAATYFNRIRGQRAANIEAAIEHFEQALTVLTREAAPQLWAAAQNNLGSAYQGRVQGERAQNRDKAIEHIEAALTVFMREATPREWAQSKRNLALAYLDRTSGERAENVEAAIAHLKDALTVFTEDAFPQEWGTTQRALGNAYASRPSGERTSNRHTAIAAYQGALTVFTRDASPLDHMRTARSLGREHLEAGDWAKAGEAYASAREAFLLLFNQGLEESETRALIADAGPLFAEAAFTALNRGEPETALLLADEGRARLLSVSLKLQGLELPDEQRIRLDRLRAEIRAARADVEATHGPEHAAALDKLIDLRQDLLDLVTAAQGAERKGASALDRARAAVGAESVIAVPIVTDMGGKIVMTGVGKDKGLAVIDAPELTTQRLSALLAGEGDDATSGWLAAYFINYLDRVEQRRRWPEWAAAIDDLGPELWRLFGARLDASLKQRGVKPGTRLVWLPSGWLGVLPLGLAQDPSSGRRLADAYEIVYAPNLEALAAAHDAVARDTAASSLAVVINPTGDLPGTEKEGSLVASHFASAARTVLKRDAATPDAVLAALKGRTHWHFASHGTFSWSDPRRSALVMAGMARLSVDRLLGADGLGHPRLVVLSACETGLTEITANPDEFIGLPGTFLALGAAGVIGTLWPVNDAATALLIAKFYDLHKGAGLAPPAALSKAQAWLRQSTRDELDAYAQAAAGQGRLEGRHLAEIGEELGSGGLAQSRNRALAEWTKRDSSASLSPSSADLSDPERPYAHPYYWAGFIYTGL